MSTPLGTQQLGEGRDGVVGRRARRALATSAALVLVALSPAISQAQLPAPVDLQLTPGVATIATLWSVSSAEPSGFSVRWKKVGGGGGGHVNLPGSARSYTIEGLRSVPYEVRVRASYGGRRAGFAAAEATPLSGSEESHEELPPKAGGSAPSTVSAAPPSTVSAAPTGPPPPSGGWSVAYADAFGARFGTGAGHDNTFFPNNCSKATNCAGFNSDEMEVMNPSAVAQTAAGLRLTCTYTAAAQQPGAKHYVCGTLRGLTEPKAGYSFFKWSPGKGQTLVFQAIAKFPINTGEADPGWWSNGPPWRDTEVDFFEGGGSSSSYTSGWRTSSLYTAWFAAPHPNADKSGFATDPSSGFHTYTFEIAANNTYSVWIDGVAQPWATNVGPVKPDLAEKAGLVLSYALRTCSCTTGFKSGTREFDVRSVAVYEDTAHKGVGIEHGGLAPGTAVG